MNPPPWSPDTPPPEARIGPAGWLRVVLRGGVLGALTFGGLAVLLTLRLAERPLCGQRRPVTPYVTQTVCRLAFVVLGMGYRTRGKPLAGPGAVVSNHASWLDIFALNARKRIYFVSKSEVAGWPAIGWLARATGTVFIDRDPRQARAQQALFQERLRAGHRLLFFPEGTSSDGLRILPFKTTLFQSFLTSDLRETLWLQPVTLRYRAPPGRDARFYGWWGDMGFAPHLLVTLAAPRQGSVEVIYHAPLRVADFPDRKALAAASEAAVRSGLPPGGQAQPE